MTREEYRFFLEQDLRRDCIMGNDYYVANEHWVSPDGRTRRAGEVFGYGDITRQYHGRYGLPVMHTETNFWQGSRGDEAVQWLWKQWANVLWLRSDGVPMMGFTWYSITDQVDWQHALREDGGELMPVGLFDLERRIQPVGEAYRRLIATWTEALPPLEPVEPEWVLLEGIAYRIGVMMNRTFADVRRDRDPVTPGT